MRHFTSVGFKMKIYLYLSIILLLGVSCTKLDQGDPIQLTTKQQQLIARDHSFAFSFIQSVAASQSKDWFVSPLGMQFLLGMLANGAQGETQAQILSVLGYGTDELAEANAFYQSLLQQLPNCDPKTPLAFANCTFLDKKLPINPSFRSCVEKEYEALVENVDFTKPVTVNKINNWCKKNTSGLIPKLMDHPNEDMLFIIMNALYFKGEWTYKFSGHDTGKELFHLETGGEREIMMMKLSKTDASKCSYSDNDFCECLRLPFGNEAFSMSIILPRKGITLPETLSYLNQDAWSALSDHISVVGKLDLWLPRFNSTCSIDLNEILSGMGMPLAFNGGSFSAISDGLNAVSLIRQISAIDINENGAEAASMSVAMGLGAIPRNLVFHADHPFLYLITESSTDMILFAGVYTGN